MTGQEFIDALQREIMDGGKMNLEYTPADLTKDAAAVGLWYRKPSEQEQMQEEDLKAAREETAKLEQPGGNV